MDENKKKALDAALAQIEKQYGKGSVMRMDDTSVVEGIQSVSDLLEIIVELEKLKSNKRTYKKFIKLLETHPSIKSYDDIMRRHESSFREIKISMPEIMWDVIDSNFYKFPPKKVRSFSVSEMNVFILQSVLKYFDSHGIDYDKEKIKKMVDNHWMVRTIL